jgi:G3E family GTPase
MSKPIRFVMIGGFLGAGKTTLISQLATRFQADGKHVCIVTNDQAAGLVDTELLRSQGHEVNEVAGSCFCCNFNGLTDAMSEFESRRRPDVILAEPVGSCTDLMATIALPMMEMLGEQFTHNPYAVVLKPSHGLKILSGTKGGFSPKAEYIFRKQLEESQIVLINRIDELPAEEVEQLVQLIDEQYPGRTIVRISARTGENLDTLMTTLDQAAPLNVKTMDVDYDIYAEGEAELGWLNATVDVESDDKFRLDDITLAVVDQIRDALKTTDSEPAHLKVLGSSNSAVAVANLVSSDTESLLSIESDSSVSSARLIVNARVCQDPDDLKQVVLAVVEALATKFGVKATVESIESFRPGRPVPTHRVAT